MKMHVLLILTMAYRPNPVPQQTDELCFLFGALGGIRTHGKNLLGRQAP